MMTDQVRFPAEWEPQSGVLLTWPHRHSDWRPVLHDVEPVYVEIARHIARFERLVILCWDDDHRGHIESALTAAGVAGTNIRYFPVPTNDTWVRDYGPVTVVQDGTPLLLDFSFNSWGNKYACDKDNLVSTRLLDGGLFGETRMRVVDMVLEGGSIETDGQGTLLTTSRCLLSPQRNPGLDKGAIEARLAAVLGVDRILWLNAGELRGDDTDGHIDILARFCTPDTLAYTRCDDPPDENHPALARMEEELRALRTRDGAPYELVPLPWPRAQFSADGQRLAAGYANFLVVNGAVMVPVYRDPADEPALRVLEQCFPGREVVPIYCHPLLPQGGSLHCATMQLPRGVLE